MSMDETGNRTNFGEWLLAERNKKGWSQADLSERSGITSASISRFETGKRGTVRKTVILLAKALDADINEALKAAGFTTENGKQQNQLSVRQSMELLTDPSTLAESLRALADHIESITDIPPTTFETNAQVGDIIDLPIGIPVRLVWKGGDPSEPITFDERDLRIIAAMKNLKAPDTD